MEQVVKTCEHVFKKGKEKGASCGEASIPLNFGWSLCPRHAPWVKKAREILISRDIAEEFPTDAGFWNEEEEIASWVAEMSTYPDQAQDPDHWTEADPQACETHTPCHEGYEEEDKNVWFVDGKEVTREVAEAEATKRDGNLPPADMGVLRDEAMARVEKIRRADRARRLIDAIKREQRKEVKKGEVLENYAKILAERHNISVAAAAQWVQGPQGCVFILLKGFRKGFPCADFRMPLDRNPHAWPLCRRHIKRMVPTSDTDPTPTLKR